MFPALYAIMDAGSLRTSELAFAEMLAQSGVELIQYRNKQVSSRELFQQSFGLAVCLRSSGARLVVNDRADIASLVNAGGVHVGQEDLDVESARAVCGPACWVGVSTHTLDQVRRADATSANYIAVGPIYATTTKEKPAAVVGTEFVCRARELTRKPLVAVGGITLERAAEVYTAGADSLAVASDLILARDPAGRAKEYLRLAARLGRRN